ncbi:hypothetical protein BD779DRAFT_1492680 [Infundibulicybe gibba]|nr:hypothetical protein BD779DRAFT_1492680 [Infundibulicybe gibba]
MTASESISDKGDWGTIPPPNVIRGTHSARPKAIVVFIVKSLFLFIVGFSLLRNGSGLTCWAVDRLYGYNGMVPNACRASGDSGKLHGRQAEAVFLSVPNPASAIAASRQFATKPHLAGSPGDLETAQDFLKLLQDELGINPPSQVPMFEAGSPESSEATLSTTIRDDPHAWIDIYYPVMNTPLDRSLQILGDNDTVLWEADLVEYADDTDPEAGKYNDAVPTFHGLSPAGDVNGTLLDGHYYITVKNTIVLCRYGAIFRGLKVKGAQDLGALGVLIYSDPRDDGTVTEANGYAPYPNGPARSPTSVQRGSVQFLSVYPGDPTTPGYPSYKNSTRTEGSNIPLIPSLPISWANAENLTKSLRKGGPWEGKRVRLANQVDTKVTPIWNTLGVIPGHIKDEVVMIGNHRDGNFFVMGATDPSSGTVSVHEVVRGFGALLRKGWKPLRTIMIASWDAEEYGLIGSTEWGEDFTDWINDHVIAYLNLDSSVSGSRLGASSSPLLSHFVRAEAIAIRESEYAAADSVGVSPLGSGSDYTVFLQRVGVPSTNGGFGSTIHDPVYHYHSVYDSERWQELYGDPGFLRHVAVAKHLGLQAMRLSNAIVLPFNTTHYARELEVYLDSGPWDVDFQALPPQMPNQKWNKEHKRQKKIKKKLRKIICRFIICKKERSAYGMATHAGFIGTLDLFTNSMDLPTLPGSLLREIKKAVQRVQIANKKLHREWFKHLGVAPGKWLGYGATTLPGLTEALTIDQNSTLARYEAMRLKQLIDKLAFTTRVRPL